MTRTATWNDATGGDRAGGQSWFESLSDAELRRQLDFLPGLAEVLMLRQVHALEHATVWVLSEAAGTPTFEALALGDAALVRRTRDDETLGGLSTERGFYLYGDVSTARVERAVRQALRRFRAGEWELAVHPRCGTNLSVAMLLAAGFGIGAHALLPPGPLQWLGMGAGAIAAAQLGPEAGSWVQRYVTTALPADVELEGVWQTHLSGRAAHFVELRWRDRNSGR